MTESRRLSDLSMSELQAALADAEERSDLSKYTHSEPSKRRATFELEAIRAEIALRHRRQST
jgi:hypothetical protein